ncbi:long-chain-acyl-CoA synthetase [Williamsia sp. 1135]|uniref:long-chain-acyl-CoA synthetase n=1 Tax=Williamsia sp. 1135 TaxID=1889262 RepID=UPI000A0F4EE1|nr:long-chain-acyl-CoA synthetase [Williamsia sp. 1135]ORM30206.1 long-chain-acyl-CoA synthetase [Williamsia sp. 1135]
MVSKATGGVGEHGAEKSVREESSHTIGLRELLAGIAEMRHDLPSIARSLPALADHRRSRKMTIGKRFQQVAATHSERPFLRFEGESISYAEANRTVNRYAALLTARGVGAGDVVAICSQNKPGIVLAMLATVKLGATAGMLNYNQRGEVLTHSLGLLKATILLVDSDVCDAFDAVPEAALPATTLSFLDLHEESLGLSDRNPSITAKLPASTTAFYIFTSGTTGMPKASVMSHSRWLAAMSGIGGVGIRLRKDDTMYASLPFYHNNALTVSLASVLTSGACLAIGKRFSASTFWDDIALNKATAFCYIGELCRYLLAQPPSPADREHSVRLVVGNGLRPGIWDEFTQRFGISRVVEFYSASEANIGFINLFNAAKTVGFCPLPYEIVDYDPDTGEPLRGGDGRLIKLPKDAAGLLVSQISKRVPFDGYTDPEASSKKVVTNAFKDGDQWFNTGDLVRGQGFSHILFVDRLGDTFRWKGENVATTEVESVLDGSGQVAQSVVFGVEVPGTDGRAGMAAIILTGGEALDTRALADHLSRQLPAYATPLFVRVVDELAHTSTFKSVKVALRDEGYSETGDDEVYVFVGGTDGYVPFYDGYAGEVAAGTLPRK